MNGFIEMDIFFVITTVVVVAIGVLLVLILLRIWRILGHVEGISRDVSAESLLLRHDIEALRHQIRTRGLKFSYVKTFFTHALKRFTGGSARKRAAARDTDE